MEILGKVRIAKHNEAAHPRDRSTHAHSLIAEVSRLIFTGSGIALGGSRNEAWSQNWAMPQQENVKSHLAALKIINHHLYYLLEPAHTHIHVTKKLKVTGMCPLSIVHLYTGKLLQHPHDAFEPAFSLHFHLMIWSTPRVYSRSPHTFRQDNTKSRQTACSSRKTLNKYKNCVINLCIRLTVENLRCFSHWKSHGQVTLVVLHRDVSFMHSPKELRWRDGELKWTA